MQTVKDFVKLHTDEMYALLKELCLIPAPSYKEDARADFCKKWFDEHCGKGAYIDEAKNVIFPYEADGSDSLAVVCAHTDTVFPDIEPMPFTDDGEKLFSPGVGDDTASLVIMMLAAKYFVENKIKTKSGLLFVANSCEEGLGNLMGTRRLFKDYEGRIASFVSYDSKFPHITSRSVGSHRYRVEVLTKGGHSWGAFGNKNAIAEIAGIAKAIYEIEVPKKEGSKVTYNVGTIEGGTSVNTIAQSAKMLCEYRSDDLELLKYMEKKFLDIFENARRDDVTVNVEKVGDRPCMGEVDMAAQEKLISLCREAMTEVTGLEANYGAGSTDCNIPLSIGIPAIAVGVYQGGGTHTREEWIYKESLIPGFEIGIKTAINITK